MKSPKFAHGTSMYDEEQKTPNSENLEQDSPPKVIKPL